MEREIELQKQIQEELAMKREEEQKRQQQLRLEQQLYEQRQQEQRKLQLNQQIAGTSNRPARQNSLMGFQSFQGFRSNTPNQDPSRALTPTNGHDTPTRSQTPTLLPAVLRVGMDSSHQKSRSNSKDSNTGLMSPPAKSTLRVDTYDKSSSRGVTPIDHSPISPMDELPNGNGTDETDKDHDHFYRDSPMARTRPSLNGTSSVLPKSANGSTRRPSREVGNAAQRRFPIKADKPERSNSMESRASRATPNSAQSSKASLADTIERLSESPEEEEEGESHEQDSSLNSSRAHSFETPRAADHKRPSPERASSNASTAHKQPSKQQLLTPFHFPAPPPKPSKVGKEIYNTPEFQQILNELRASPLEKPDGEWDDSQYQRYLDDDSGEIQEMLGRIYDIPEDVQRSFDAPPTADDKLGKTFTLAMAQLEELEQRLDQVFQDFFIQNTGIDPFQEPDAIIGPEERRNRDRWIEEQKKKLGTNDLAKIPSFRSQNGGKGPYETDMFPKPSSAAPSSQAPQAPRSPPRLVTSPNGVQGRVQEAPGRVQQKAAVYQSYMNQPHPHQQQQQRPQQGRVMSPVQQQGRVMSPVQQYPQQQQPLHGAPRAGQGSRQGTYPARQASQDQYGQQHQQQQQQQQQRPQQQQQQYGGYAQQQQQQYGSYRGYAPSAPPASAPPPAPMGEKVVGRPRNR
ncbi:hypothetical protein BJ508DRAFT_37666 [Ascobolus immersus RN42]|uniref:Uncharacterized protein n=1 Tax=Ascobolus immersus RN42 TaxID=1160509 RepID=A0A3N4II56_ASCIM|nr:hypothetical protein BJ508DRAFT_37666 [Ascobolus immersus RN42]